MASQDNNCSASLSIFPCPLKLNVYNCVGYNYDSCEMTLPVWVVDCSGLEAFIRACEVLNHKNAFSSVDNWQYCRLQKFVLFFVNLLLHSYLGFQWGEGSMGGRLWSCMLALVMNCI